MIDTVNEKEFIKATTSDPVWSYSYEGSKALYNYLIEQHKKGYYINFLCKCCFYKNLHKNILYNFEEFKSMEQWNKDYTDNQITDIPDLLDFTEVIYDYSNKQSFIVDINY